MSPAADKLHKVLELSFANKIKMNKAERREMIDIHIIITQKYFIFVEDHPIILTLP